MFPWRGRMGLLDSHRARTRLSASKLNLVCSRTGQVLVIVAREPCCDFDVRIDRKSITRWKKRNLSEKTQCTQNQGSIEMVIFLPRCQGVGGTRPQ